MELISRLLEGTTVGPFRNLLELMSLNPDSLGAALVLLAATMILNDLVRTALMTEHTRSVAVHVIVNVLTLLPAFVLGAALIYAGYRFPHRAWVNLGLAALLYGAWYTGGTLTWLARRDTEGADLGWMAHGAIVTLICGLLAVVLF